MKLPPFSLIHAPLLGYFNSEDFDTGYREAVSKLKATAPDLLSKMAAINGNLQRTLLTSTVAMARSHAPAVDHLRQAVTELTRQQRVATVGIWDMSTQVGRLPSIIAGLNEVQKAFAFFEVQAAVPAFLVSRPERVQHWLRLHCGKRIRRADLQSGVIFEDFYPHAREVRRDLGLEHLVGITPYLITAGDRGDASYDYFSVSRDQAMLASTIDMYQYGIKAERAFEAAVGMIFVAALLVEVNADLDFHEETRGCVFDYNDDRSTIVAGLKAMQIESSCIKLIRPEYRSAAVAMIKMLREYSGPSRQAAGDSSPPKSVPPSFQSSDGHV